MAEVELAFETSSNSADAIQRAAYRFIDRFSLELSRDADVFRCILRFPPDAVADDETVADFRNEVLDQVLRERIRTETEGVRNLVLALAFSNTSLSDG